MATVRKDVIQLSIEINGTKAGATYDQLKRNARDLNREINKLTPGTDAFIKKTQELQKVNNVLATIRKSTAGVAHGTSSLTNIWKKGVIASVAFFSTQRIVEWGKQFVGWVIKGTAALEASRRKTAIVFGEAIDIVQDAAAINAQSLGVTEQAYASLAAQIGDILIPMGFQREEAAKLSTDLTDLSGALAEWDSKQRSAEEITKILSKALTGERESLKELGIVITEADVQSRLLAKGQKELTGAALQQAKALINYELILERSKDAQQAFATNQDAMRRSSSRLGSVFAQLQENFLSKLLPGVKGLTNAIADSLAPIKLQSDLVADSKEKINALAQTVLSGNLSYNGRKQALEQINALLPPHIAQLDTEATTNEQLAITIRDVNAAMDQRIDALLKEEKVLDARRRQQTAEEAKDAAQRRVTEQERLRDRLAAQRAAGTNEGAGQLDQGQAERQNAALLAEARRALAAATNKLALEETHLLSVRNANSDIADEVLSREAANQAAKDKLAAENAQKEADRLAREQAEKDKQARERRLRDQLKAIEDQYDRERQIKIQSIEFLRDNEEAYAAERERINLEADIKIARAQADLYKKGTTENLQLLQTALDKEAELRKQAYELTNRQRIEQIERESQLTQLAIREEIEDKEELSRRLEIEELRRQQRLAEVRLASLTEADAEYIQLYNEITDRQLEIARREQADRLAIDEQTIELQRELTLAGIDQAKLDEEDLQKYRERINLEYDRKILEARLKTFDPASVDGVRTQNQIAEIDRQLAQQGSGFLVPGDVAGAGGSSSPDDQDTKRKRAQEIEQAAIGTAHNIADTLLSIEQERIDTQLQMELSAIETQADARRKAAGDDAVLLAKIDAEALAAREKAEKKAAQDRKKLARKEAIIQGALAVVEALPNAAAAIAAGIATALQLAVIDGQSFFYGGPTGSKGIYKDKSGHDVAGVVHTDEYVVPARIAKDPQHQPVISYLERVRQSRGGYADGGLVNVSTRPATYVQTMTGAPPSKEMQEIRSILADIRDITSAWPTVIKAVLSYTDFESTRDTVDEIRGQSRV